MIKLDIPNCNRIQRNPEHPLLLLYALPFDSYYHFKLPPQTLFLIIYQLPHTFSTVTLSNNPLFPFRLSLYIQPSTLI